MSTTQQRVVRIDSGSHSMYGIVDEQLYELLERESFEFSGRDICMIKIPPLAEQALLVEMRDNGFKVTQKDINEVLERISFHNAEIAFKIYGDEGLLKIVSCNTTRGKFVDNNDTRKLLSFVIRNRREALFKYFDDFVFSPEEFGLTIEFDIEYMFSKHLRHGVNITVHDGSKKNFSLTDSLAIGSILPYTIMFGRFEYAEILLKLCKGCFSYNNEVIKEALMTHTPEIIIYTLDKVTSECPPYYAEKIVKYLLEVAPTSECGLWSIVLQCLDYSMKRLVFFTAAKINHTDLFKYWYDEGAIPDDVNMIFNYACYHKNEVIANLAVNMGAKPDRLTCFHASINEAFKAFVVQFFPTFSPHIIVIKDDRCIKFTREYYVSINPDDYCKRVYDMEYRNVGIFRPSFSSTDITYAIDLFSDDE